MQLWHRHLFPISLSQALQRTIRQDAAEHISADNLNAHSDIEQEGPKFTHLMPCSIASNFNATDVSLGREMFLSW
jgi:hypothetical protein